MRGGTLCVQVDAERRTLRYHAERTIKRYESISRYVGKSVAARLAGGGDLADAAAGKPDCYKGLCWAQIWNSTPILWEKLEPCDSPGRDRTMRRFR
jgi:hypothetical protein